MASVCARVRSAAVLLPFLLCVCLCAQVQTAPSRLQIVTAPPAAALPAGKRKQHVTIKVDAAAPDWTDTGVVVAAGESLQLSATGEIELAGHTLTPDGMTRGWRDMLRRFPVDTANAGALVGKIGDSAAAVPFAIGRSATVAAAQTGTFFVRVNASSDLPATGAVQVDVRVSAAAAVAASTLQAKPFATLALTALDALPRRVTDRNGEPGDAVNFALIGTEQQVRDAFARAGWVAVDMDTGSAVLHGLLSTLEHKPYVEVPMSTLYLFGRAQDLSFARASALAVAAERHHLRCWKTEALVNGAPLWIGAATHDIGFERDQRNGQITHRIAPEVDLERDFLRDSFAASGATAATAYFTPLDPVRQAQTATGGSFTSDGRILLMQLR